MWRAPEGPEGLAAVLVGGGTVLPRVASRKLACNSIGRSFNKGRKRCNSNDLNSKFEIVVGELHAKLGVGTGMRGVRGPPTGTQSSPA